MNSIKYIPVRFSALYHHFSMLPYRTDANLPFLFTLDLLFLSGSENQHAAAQTS